MNKIMEMMYECLEVKGRDVLDVELVIGKLSIKDREIFNKVLRYSKYENSLASLILSDHIAKKIIVTIESQYLPKEKIIVPEFLINYFNKCPNINKVVNYCFEQGMTSKEFRKGLRNLSPLQRRTLMTIFNCSECRLFDLFSLNEITKTILENTRFQKEEVQLFNEEIMNYVRKYTSDLYIALADKKGEITVHKLDEFMKNKVTAEEKEFLLKLYKPTFRNIDFLLDISSEDLMKMTLLVEDLKKRLITRSNQMILQKLKNK